MKYRRQRALTLAFVLAGFAASALAYPDLPARMATHWNASGEVDGTMSRLAGAFFLPALTAFVVGLLLAAPSIDPRKQRYESFRGVYEWVVAGTAGFLAYVHVLVLAWNLDYAIPIGQALAPAFAALLYACGVLLDRAEPNWFVGVRTPWTLDDDEVWRETHERGALAFKLAAVLALGGVVLPDYFLVFVVAPTLLAAAYATVYSYLAYRRREA
ncbi:SdpI family protein [Salarchaeum sp. JOR-1]|nr:SdpI family protein [Salarchaeum sp. JOR-1]